MVEIDKRGFKPDYAVPPGETLRELLEEGALEDLEHRAPEVEGHQSAVPLAVFSKAVKPRHIKIAQSNFIAGPLEACQNLLLQELP
jgi:hypothetical protein